MLLMQVSDVVSLLMQDIELSRSACEGHPRIPRTSGEASQASMP
jgi:hypothetical protein